MNSDTRPNIEGIYNYCDRWCERCKYTDRCLNFQKQLEAGIDPLERDIPQEKAWAYIGKCLADAMEMLQQMAEEEGIDLDNLEAVEEIPPSQKAARFEAETRATYMQYLKLSQAFFVENATYFDQKGAQSIRWVELGMDSEEATLSQWQRINDQVEVLYWYQHFIGAKLDRATSGIDEMHAEHWGRPEQSDANRTARILMVALNRSIAAWRVLHHVFAEKEDAILQMLALLARLRQRVEQMFPRWSEAGPNVDW